MRFIVVLFICAILFLLGRIAYDSNRFHVVHYDLQSNKIKKDFHFVFISDLHDKQYGKGNVRLLQAIEECLPDAILIGGDILTAKPGRDTGRAAEFVERLAEKYPLYYANGNHEQRLDLYPENYGDMGRIYENRLAEAGIVRLVNRDVMADGYGVNIVGCEIDREYYKRFRRVPMPDDYLSELLPKRQDALFTILLAHNPVYFQNYSRWGADLTLSGHIHGGVVRLPFLGGVIGTDFRFFPRYDGGIFREDGKCMIVSRGLGAHTIPFRLFNPAELVDVVITADQKDIR